MDEISIFLAIIAGIGFALYAAAMCLDLMRSKRDKKNEDDRDREE